MCRSAVGRKAGTDVLCWVLNCVKAKEVFRVKKGRLVGRRMVWSGVYDFVRGMDDAVGDGIG